MAISWASAGYTYGEQTSGKIDTLAPIPTGYGFIKGQSWNLASSKKRIFGDVYGYAERTSATTAKVYLCQRGWIYNTGATDYASWQAVTGNNVVRSTSGYAWAYNSTSAFSVTGSSTSSLGTWRWGSSDTTYSPYGGSLALQTNGRSWWKQLFTITDIPVTTSTTEITLSFGAVGGSYSNEFETSAAWTAKLSIPAMSVKVKVSGAWKSGAMWVKTGGTWKKGTVWVKVNGVWKKS